MMKITSVLAVILFCFAANAQDAEVTTYFGEKNGFQVDFPTDWTVAITEQKVMLAYITVLIGIKPNTPGAVAQIKTGYGCKSPKSEIKTWISIFEKDAKKSKDPKFLVHGQGEGMTPDGKEFSYFDYTYTLKGEDGSSTVIRRRFYITCNSYKRSQFAFNFFFEAKDEEWDKFSATYEKIFNSVKYK